MYSMTKALCGRIVVGVPWRLSQINQFSHAISVMRVGLSVSSIRRRYQTALSCIRKERLWWASKEKAGIIPQGMNEGDEHKWTIEEVSIIATDVKTGILTSSWDKSDGHLSSGLVTSGIEMAWTSNQALIWNLGSCRSDVKGAGQAENLQDPEYQSGAQRRSHA